MLRSTWGALLVLACATAACSAGPAPSTSSDASESPEAAPPAEDTLKTDAEEAKTGACAISALCWRTLPGDKYASVIYLDNEWNNKVTKAQCDSKKMQDELKGKVHAYCKKEIQAELNRRTRPSVLRDSEIDISWESEKAEWLEGLSL
jgi:hypothetical protein